MWTHPQFAPHRYLSVPLFLIYLLHLSHLLVRTSGPASCFVSVSESSRYKHLSIWVLPHGGTALEGTEYHGASPHPICITKQRPAVPRVPPLFPLISPRGIHQSPNPQKLPGREGVETSDLKISGSSTSPSLLPPSPA